MRWSCGELRQKVIDKLAPQCNCGVVWTDLKSNQAYHVKSPSLSVYIWLTCSTVDPSESSSAQTSVSIQCSKTCTTIKTWTWVTRHIWECKGQWDSVYMRKQMQLYTLSLSYLTNPQIKLLNEVSSWFIVRRKEEQHLTLHFSTTH